QTMNCHIDRIRQNAHAGVKRIVRSVRILATRTAREGGDMRLKDRVAIVTGGGRGIGAVYCRALAREGAAVVAADVDEAGARSVADSIAAEGGRAVACRVDVADPADTAAMARAAVEVFGGIDVLVNNAAMYANLTRKRFDQITPEEFDRVLAVNVKG